MSKTKTIERKKIINEITRLEMVCPKHGKCGFTPKDKSCSLCGKKLLKLRTLNIPYGVLSSWHRKDTGKHKKNPHIKWEIQTGMFEQDVLDAIVNEILFGGSSASIKLEFLEKDENETTN